LKRDFYSNIFLVPWGAKAHYQPQGSKQLCSSRTLQDGGYSHFEGPPGAGRLAGKDRPEGRILCNSNTPITSEVPAVQEKLLPMLCPMGIHKNPETSPSSATPQRDSDDCQNRQHTPYSRVQGEALDQSQAVVYLLECLGFTINTEKSVLTPNQTIEFLDLTVNSINMEL